MRFFVVFALVVACFCTVSAAARAERVHEVASGQTLGRIAKRYNVTIAAICTANDIRRRDPIHPGQKLIIPDKSDKDGSRARKKQRKAPRRAKAAEHSEKKRASGAQVLHIPGYGPAYYYSPVGPGRLTLRPVMMYLHGRGGHPERDCQRWAPIARRVGWLMCPSGPGATGHGRGWNNNWASAHRIAMASLKALRKKYGRRVQLYGNTLIGFSEGAFAAMNVGVRESRAFNRWLILAANDDYWGGAGHEQLKRARSRVRRVYLITGEKDSVIGGTRRVREWLRDAGVSTRITTPDDMGHELALERKSELYRMALVWLQRG